jgi:salicylate hydroxylase
MRGVVLEKPLAPAETGDLAYRGTFSHKQLSALNNERINAIIAQPSMQVWLGAGKHGVFYPLRNLSEFNLVLLYIIQPFPQL